MNIRNMLCILDANRIPYIHLYCGIYLAGKPTSKHIPDVQIFMIIIIDTFSSFFFPFLISWKRKNHFFYLFRCILWWRRRRRSLLTKNNFSACLSVYSLLVSNKILNEVKTYTIHSHGIRVKIGMFDGLRELLQKKNKIHIKYVLSEHFFVIAWTYLTYMY